jgi:hypothetical protein
LEKYMKKFIASVLPSILLERLKKITKALSRNIKQPANQNLNWLSSEEHYIIILSHENI